MKLIMRLLLFLIFVFSIFGVVACTNNSDVNLVETNIEGEGDNLVGTCRFDRACTTPSCAQWVDSDHDGNCDRGVHGN